ncbi:MAG: M1 family metallopeptidase [Terriglobales bacterium]
MREKSPSPCCSRRMLALACCFIVATACAQASPPRPDCPQTTSELYARIRSVRLDPQRLYQVRNASIDRPNLHLDLDDGTLAFTEDICGRITGALFQGDGEIRLRPPNRVERGSMALFTGMALLEEQFTSAYLRFNDDTAELLKPFLTPATEEADVVRQSIEQWNNAAGSLAEFDALRLFLDFSHFLPVLPADGRAGPSLHEPERKFPPLLHAHLLGKRLGAFEVFWDAATAEPLWAGQPLLKDGSLFFDLWTSFAPPAAPASRPEGPLITAFRIRASVEPPTMLRASTEVNVHVRAGGERTLIFELSRYLKLDAVEAAGLPADFIQNPAIEGSALQRKGNDLVAVIFPAPLAAGQELKLRFTYAGEVLSEAGKGLLYVGERGTWYPSFGLSPAQFDIEFHYPPSWTLVATGKQISSAGKNEDEDNNNEDKNKTQAEANPPAPAEKVSRWVSDQPIPVAGFNLGKYVRAEARAGDILIEAFGTKGVEKSFPKPQPKVIEPPVFQDAPTSRVIVPLVLTPPPPSPARDAQAVADRAAKAVESFSQWFGPYPYNSLGLTQLPGNLSQGWPGLVFLSSFAFLSPQEQEDLRLDPAARELDTLVLAHETAHQWWGDLVGWKSYRDQWIAEGLANYSSLLLLERRDPAQFRQVLETYRRDLLTTNKAGERLRDAGPVTLGPRLDSSHFPQGYESISYERGTWLFHMLRSMLRDSSPCGSDAASRARKARPSPPPNSNSIANSNSSSSSSSNDPFFRALRRVRDRYQGKTITTEELLAVFQQDLPRPLWYEKRPKLDWFLQGWIDGTSIPELSARDIRITDKNGVTTVTGVIVQKDVPDDLVTAVPVYAITAPGNAQVFLGEVLADGPDTAFRLPAPTAVRKILLDPKQTILSAPK